MPMLNPMRGFPALAYWSHKVLRWLCPFFLIALLVTNLCLLNARPIYCVGLILQAAFYLSAWIGWRRDRVTRERGQAVDRDGGRRSAR